jgi:DNA repair protein RecN (Recombination protein N)
VSQAWARLSENIAAERELTAALERRREQRELTRFQIDEIRAAGMAPDEDEKLRADAVILKNARRLAETAEQTLAELSEADDAVASRTAALLRNARKMAEIDARWTTVVEQLTTAQEGAEDLSRYLNDYRLHLDFDPARLEAVESRLSELFRLKSKYGESCAAVLQHLEQLEKESQASGREEEHLAELVKQRAGLERNLAAHAAQLSKSRRDAVPVVEKKINALLAGLGMPDAELKIELAAFTDRVCFSRSNRSRSDIAMADANASTAAAP